MNCQEITTSIQAIKSMKDDFDKELRQQNFETCLVLKYELSDMVKELKEELWLLEKLSIENIKSIYEQYKSVFEKSGIVENGKIISELLPDELKQENFFMPTVEQFLDYILSKKEQLIEMVELGLTEPVIVPIAADFGKDSESGGVHNYSGLLGILAEEIRDLGQKGLLKGSDGVFLPSRTEWNSGSVDPKQPINVDDLYKKMQYVFKEKDGVFSALSQTELIQKHKEANSPFPGFAIYLKEKGDLLTCVRDEKDSLYEMAAWHNYKLYRESLRKLGLCGTTAHTELVMLLSSLQKDGKVMRDDENPKDAAGIICGNTFHGYTGFGRCGWLRDAGCFCLDTRGPDDVGSKTAGIALGELI